jgi:hypothetical protein
VNSHLKPRGKTVSNLEQDLADGLSDLLSKLSHFTFFVCVCVCVCCVHCFSGLLLVDLLEAISGESFPYKYEKNPNLRIKKVSRESLCLLAAFSFRKVGNVGHCLKFIESKGVKLAGIGPEGTVPDIALIVS